MSGWDHEENSPAPPPPWKDETYRCPQCGTVHPLLAAKDARIAELERIIEDAPHGSRCSLGLSQYDGAKWRIVETCDCWKSKARAR